METKFQTSFIPKKPIATEQKIRITGGTSILMFVGSLLFVVSLAAAGLTFVGKNLLLKTQEQRKIDLGESRKRFNENLILELKKADTKITFAKGLLDNHLAVSEIFDIIAKLTIQGVRFKSLDFTAPDVKSANGNVAKISLKGVANSYSSIAWQSDVLGRSDKFGRNIILKNPILSDLSVDENGMVGFNLTAEIGSEDISYKKTLMSALEAEGIIPEEFNE